MTQSLSLKEEALKYEAYRTPDWAVDAVLDCEVMTNRVVDPCAGWGVLAEAARDRGHNVISFELSTRWGYGPTGIDFLKIKRDLSNSTVFLNPPFSKAQEFIEHCHGLNARKIICFQRLAFWESEKRRVFWNKFPPNRIYLCGNRASCWRMDLTAEEIKKKSQSTTAHAWFVWEKGQPQGTVIGHIYRTKGGVV